MLPARQIARLLHVGIMFGAVVCHASITWAIVPDFAVPSGQRQLFLDDHGIADTDGLTRTMHQPQKYGDVIRPPLGVSTACQTRTAPFWVPEENVFKFLVWTTPGSPRWYTSPDGLNWTGGDYPNKPIWLVAYDHQDADPARRYKAVLPNEGVAVSPDGTNWSMVPGVPGIPSWDEYQMSLDQKNHQFIVTVKRGGTYGRSVALATSNDFQNWSDHGLIFQADTLDQIRGVENIEARLADPTLQQPIYNDPADYNVDVYNLGSRTNPHCSAWNVWRSCPAEA